MRRAMRGAIAVWSGVRRAAEVAIVVLSLGVVVSTFAQVIARYVFDAPLIWSEELARYLFIWLSFLGAWLAWVRREHLGIDVLAEAAPAPVAAALRVVAEAVVVVFAVVAMAYGQRLLKISMNQPSAVLRIPMAWIYAAFFVGMTMIVIETLLGWASRLLGQAKAGEA